MSKPSEPSKLSKLELQPLWNLFQWICDTPHPSGNEEELSAKIKKAAEKKNLKVIVDTGKNLIIYKPATVGMEHRQGVILQAHLDMVPQSDNTKFNFNTNSITTDIVDGWVTAKQTTLGADNGIGVAACLAILGLDLDDNTVKPKEHECAHGPLEVLLTVDEEVGMTGARNLQTGLLTGSMLINTDSEKEGEIYLGCAGATHYSAEFISKLESIDEQAFTGYKIEISGLQGGHSGVDIHLDRANANGLMLQLLNELSKKDEDSKIRLTSFIGGNLINAIPRSAVVIVQVSVTAVAQFNATVNGFIDNQLVKWKDTKPAKEEDLKITFTKIDNKDMRVIDIKCQNRLLNTLTSIPNKVICDSKTFEAVDTSLNLGVIKDSAKGITVKFSLRSLTETNSDKYHTEILSIFEQNNLDKKDAIPTTSSSYPSWQPENNSKLAKLFTDTYSDLFFGAELKQKVIHAGLECALFKQHYPHLEMVSIGPTIINPHSPNERVMISSVDKFWKLLTAVLARIPEKA